MKSQKGFKATGHTSDADDAIRKPAKLDPIRKSGKEKHSLYGSFDDEEDELEEEYAPRKKESVLDYFDDGEDEED